MKTFELKGKLRDSFGKKSAISYRKEGLVPCVSYGGKDVENINFLVKSRDLRGLIYTPESFIVNVDLGDKSMLAILKEVQYHPVTDDILHIDFFHVFPDVPVVIDVPVRLEGLAAGVKAGGKLSLDSRKLKVRAMLDKLPEELVVNVEKLVLGSSIQVRDLEFEGLELLSPKNAVVCRVQLTRVARGAAAAAGLTEDDSEEDDSETTESEE